MRGEEGKRIKVKGTQHLGEEYREEDNLGEHTIPLVHHPSYRLRCSFTRITHSFSSFLHPYRSLCVSLTPCPPDPTPVTVTALPRVPAPVVASPLESHASYVHFQSPITHYPSTHILPLLTPLATRYAVPSGPTACRGEEWDVDGCEW